MAELDIMPVEEPARKARPSLDGARGPREKDLIAQALQESMVPAVRPTLTGVDVSYRYLPAGCFEQIGGDWFDALPLADGHTVLAVGDVMAPGWRSAVMMGQLRTALHALCTLDLPPDALLSRLDRLAQGFGDSYLATCLLVTYDPGSRRCRMASAGHIPPVLVAPDGRAEVLQPPTGPPVGTGGTFETVEFGVPDGSHLVLCTDGLVEVRGQDIADGLAGLCDRVAGRTRPLEQVCEDAVRPLRDTPRPDDLALLVARFHGPDTMLETGLTPAPGVTSQARRFARAALARWQLEDLLPEVELLVSELVANAVRHATDPIRLRLARTPTLLCEVSDGTPTMPRLRPPDDDSEHGRGLHLVEALSAAWGACPTAQGKTVWFELPSPCSTGPGPRDQSVGGSAGRPRSRR